MAGDDQALDHQALRERVAALKHDLGKYVAWTSANLDEEAWEGPVDDGFVDALVGDLLQTRKREGGAETAWDVWERLAGDMSRPLDVPELSEVDEAVAQLRKAEQPLRARDADAIARLRGPIREAQGRIRSALSTLHRRLARG